MQTMGHAATNVLDTLRMRRNVSAWALPGATGQAAKTRGTTPHNPAVNCPLCKDAGWFRRYRNGRDAFGGTEVVPCFCKQEHLRQKAWERARRASNIGGALQWLALDNFDRRRQPEAYSAAVAFCNDPERASLVLAGEVGTGKTHLLAAIANCLLTTKYRPVYHVLPELLRHLRQGFDAGDYQRRWEDVRSAEVLLLDDYGAEQSTPWGDETLFTLVDYRWAYRLPTVVATNLIDEAMPARIASRLHDRARSRVITMRGGDYRRSAQRAAERTPTAAAPAS